jgi:phenylpropionate dioxygenase-like ring-hydroxylating dioxygenase large terminal subunit
MARSSHQRPRAAARCRARCRAPDLPAVVAGHGLDVGDLRFHRRYPYELRANWKIALENSLECYHCALNHPASSTRSTTARCGSNRPARG